MSWGVLPADSSASLPLHIHLWSWPSLLLSQPWPPGESGSRKPLSSAYSLHLSGVTVSALVRAREGKTALSTREGAKRDGKYVCADTHSSTLSPALPKQLLGGSAQLGSSYFCGEAGGERGCKSPLASEVCVSGTFSLRVLSSWICVTHGHPWP